MVVVASYYRDVSLQLGLRLEPRYRESWIASIYFDTKIVLKNSTFQHSMDPKYTSKSAMEYLDQHFEHSSQNPDLNPIKKPMECVHRRIPDYLIALKHFFQGRNK